MTNIEELEILLATLTKEAKSYGLPLARLSDIDNVRKTIRAVQVVRKEKSRSVPT
jgi:hypothetical protein